MSGQRPRLQPLPPEQWDEKTRKILGGTIAPVAALEERDAPSSSDAPSPSGPLNILRTIAHHPRLLEPFLGFAATLATRGVLPRRASELLALRTAWNCRSAFEWGHHVLYARAAGLDEDEIARITAGPEHADWDASDRWLLRAADQLHSCQQLADDVFEALRAEWSDAQLVEIPFIVGQYTMLSMVANATDVALEAGLPPLPQPRR